MKKVLLIITCLWCALCVSANPVHVSATMNYSSTYRSTGRTGYAYPAGRVHNASIGLAQTPVATMGSTRSTAVSMPAYASAASNNMMSVNTGIYTAASQISGGVTTSQTYSPMGRPRRSGGHHGEADTCPGCIDSNHDGVCDVCGHDIDDLDDEGFCPCAEESGNCGCPISDGWPVWLFLSLLAGAYAVYKKRTSTVQ